MTGKIGDHQLAARQERHELAEVPRGAAVAVNEQERPALSALEDADPRPTVRDPALRQPRQQLRRIRHPDRLFFVHCECDGDRTGRVKITALRRKELDT